MSYNIIQIYYNYFLLVFLKDLTVIGFYAMSQDYLLKKKINVKSYLIARS